jgi:hypothetical protein
VDIGQLGGGLRIDRLVGGGEGAVKKGPEWSNDKVKCHRDHISVWVSTDSLTVRSAG